MKIGSLLVVCFSQWIIDQRNAQNCLSREENKMLYYTSILSPTQISATKKNLGLEIFLRFFEILNFYFQITQKFT